MVLFDLIVELKKNGTWGKLCAINTWAMYKEVQYRIYKVVQTQEPTRSYGYRVRIVDYLCANKVLDGLGVFTKDVCDPDTIKFAIRDMESPIADELPQITKLNDT